MTQRQIIDNNSNNLLVLVGSTRVLSEINLKFIHLKYERNIHLFGETLILFSSVKLKKVRLDGKQDVYLF